MTRSDQPLPFCREAERPIVIELRKGDRPFSLAMLPPGWQSEIVKNADLEHTPEIVSGTIATADSDSFKEYFDRFNTEHSILIASRSNANVIATLDYHKGPNYPGPAKHRLYRKYAKSRRFNEWVAKNGVSMTQKDFVIFLEDRLIDIIDPVQSQLMMSITQFKMTRNTTCHSAVDLSSGDVKFSFINDSKGISTDAVIPERIGIKVPIFEFEQDWEIHARLSYRLDEGKISFSYKLINIDDVGDAAFIHAVSALERMVDAPILMGD